MIRNSTIAKGAGLVLAASLLFAACGGGGSGSDSGLPGVPDNELAEAITGVNSECFEIAAAYAAIGLGALGASFGVSESELAELQDSIRELEASIPNEIAGDFEVFADAFGEYFETIGSLDLMNPANAAQIEAASQTLESPEVLEAQANIEAYLDRECADYAN